MAFRLISSSEENRVRFEEVGQTVEGKLIEAKTVTPLNGTPFNKYVVQSDQGVVSFLGCYKLDEILPKIPLGTVIRVIYTGKERIKGGKSMKSFQIMADQDCESALAV